MTTVGAATWGHHEPGGEGLEVEQVLEAGLSATYGRLVRIAALDGQPLDMQSTYPIDRLEVLLDSGERLSVIFKRLNAEPSPKGSQREVLIYGRLLTGQRFGAPALYASTYDEARERYWLFLEDVGEWHLGNGDTEDWEAAARWLGGMHGTYHGREEELRALRCLDEHGPEFYQRLARGARHHLQMAAPRRALAHFDRLMARYELVVEYLTCQPRTLVHGDIFADNIAIQPGARIRPLDWEAAAVGLGACDLARLLEGWGADKPAFIAAYLEELERHTGMAANRREFSRTLARCEVLNVLWHLGWEVEACRDVSFVDGSLRQLQRAWERLDEEDDDG